MAFCAPPVHKSLHRFFVRPFTDYITPLSRACGHFITCLMMAFASNYSAIRTELAQGGVLCSASTQVTTSFLRAAIYWLYHAIVTRMRPFYHVPYDSVCVKLQCYKNGTCTRWRFVLRLYTNHYIVSSCGHLLIISRHCHTHTAILSRFS